MDKNFEENHSSGSCDAAEDVYCSSREETLIVDRSQPNLHNL